LLAADEADIPRALSSDPDLLIADEVMFRVVSQAKDWLRTRSGGKLLPIVLVIPEQALIAKNLDEAVDDFVVDPYRRVELLSRIGRVLANVKERWTDTIIRRGALTIDSASYEVRVGKRKVDLTFREYQILTFLADHPGRVIARHELLAEVWGADHFGGNRTIDVHIRRLRSKIEDADHSFIETVRNVGYKFKRFEDLDTHRFTRMSSRSTACSDTTLEYTSPWDDAPLTPITSRAMQPRVSSRVG